MLPATYGSDLIASASLPDGIAKQKYFRLLYCNANSYLVTDPVITSTEKWSGNTTSYNTVTLTAATNDSVKNYPYWRIIYLNFIGAQLNLMPLQKHDLATLASTVLWRKLCFN